MTAAAETAPDAPLSSYLDSFVNESYRARVGPLGVLRLLEPTRLALENYEGELVAAARKAGHTWDEIGAALGKPKQTVHRRWGHVG